MKPIRAALVLNQLRRSSRIERADSTFIILLAYILFGFAASSSKEKNAFPLI